MNCVNCGAPMRLAGPGSYLYCRYCSSFHFLDTPPDGVRTQGEESGHTCGVCRGALLEAVVAGAAVRQCERCRGILVRRVEFAPLVRYLRSRAGGAGSMPRPLNRDDLRRLLHCPFCGQKMDTHPYYGPGNIVIDLCPRCCLIWLDRGELAAIMAAPGRDRGQAVDLAEGLEESDGGLR